MADVLSFGWYRITAQAVLPLLMALDADAVEPGMEPWQWRAAMAEAVQQGFLSMDLAELLAGMLLAPAHGGENTDDMFFKAVLCPSACSSSRRPRRPAAEGSAQQQQKAGSVTFSASLRIHVFAKVNA